MNDVRIDDGIPSGEERIRQFFMNEGYKAHLKMRFGIDNIVESTANGSFSGDFALSSDYSRISFAVISDGKVTYRAGASWSGFGIQELLNLEYEGRLRAEVEGATWTAACYILEGKPSCSLYTSCDDFVALESKLADRLKILDYQFFTEALEDIELTPEMMEVFGKRKKKEKKTVISE